MVEFKFDINLSVQENTELFFMLMESVDEEMTKLLMSNIDKMIPFPDPPQRKTARVAFNEAVMEGLGNLIRQEGSEP